MDKTFYSTVGIEYTYLWPRKEKTEHNRVYAAVYNLIADYRETKKKDLGAIIDEGAIEIRSPVFRSMKSVKTFQIEMEKAIAKYELVTHRGDTYSGGGHIHFGIKPEMRKNPKLYLLFLTNLFRDVNNRPYLNWIFNEWCNIKSAKSFVHYEYKVNIFHPYEVLHDLLFDEHFVIPPSWTTGTIEQVFDCAKGYACRLDSPVFKKKKATVEFRFFDTKRNFQETRLHLNFVNAYLKWIDKLTREGKVIRPFVRTKQDIEGFARFDMGLSIFKSFLEEELELPYGPYEHFVNINYRERREKGLLK